MTLADRQMGAVWKAGHLPHVRRIRCEDDLTPADWFLPLVHGFAVDTGSIIPEGFDTYCRILHPLRTHSRNPMSRTWAEVAAANGRIAHSQMQIHRISRPAGTPSAEYELNDYLNELEWGTLPLPERSLLVGLLRERTATPEQCWFCIWEGFGGLDLGGRRRVHLPQRDYALYGGPIEMALASLEPLLAGDENDGPDETGIRQSPNLWWPEDRSWFVATEIDFAWTYVGGTEATIQAILDAHGLEAFLVELTDKPFVDSDVVNAALDEGPSATGPGRSP
jgi:hypothetical protein